MSHYLFAVFAEYAARGVLGVWLLSLAVSFGADVRKWHAGSICGFELLAGAIAAVVLAWSAWALWMLTGTAGMVGLVVGWVGLTAWRRA